MDHPHLDLALSLWQATSESDAARLEQLLDPHVTWSFLLAGSRDEEAKGVDEVISSLARTGELVDDLCSELLDVYASDYGAVLFYRLEASRGPRNLSTDVLLQLDIADGRVVAGRAVPVRPEESRSFWLAQ
jgi:ketosteroid isomerase-like protein